MFGLQKITALLLILGLSYGNDAIAKSKTLKDSEDSSRRVARGALRPKVSMDNQKKNKRVSAQNSKEKSKAIVKTRKPSAAQQRKLRELLKKSAANAAPSAKRSRALRSQARPAKAHSGKKADLKEARSVKRRRISAKKPTPVNKPSSAKKAETTTKKSPTRKLQTTTRGTPARKGEAPSKTSPVRKPVTNAPAKKQSSTPRKAPAKKPEAAPKKTPAVKHSSGKKNLSSKKKESKKKPSGKAPVFEAPKEYAVRVKDLPKDQKKRTEQYLGEGLYKEGTIRFAHPDLKSPDYEQFLELMKNERKKKKAGKSLYTFEQHYQNPKYEPTWLNKPIVPKTKFGPFAIR